MSRSLWEMWFLLLPVIALGETPSSPPKTAADRPIREIFVPFEDLNVILDNDHQRVFLTREEYEELIKQGKSKLQKPAPHKVALIAAQYQGELLEGRALIRGDLTIEVLQEGLFALPLDLAGVGIRSASLDGSPAPLFSDASQRPTLLVRGTGLHKLEIQLIAPLQTVAAQQTMQLTLPTQAATRLKLSVPGNVEVKGGAAVVSRNYDMSADKTRLEILPQKGGMAIAMSLNNRLLQEQRVIITRSVIVDEITQGYERIHATVSCRILHGSADKLRLVVPAGFEVMKVESLLLTRWVEKSDAERKVLEVTLREPTSEQVVLHLTFNRSPSTKDWLADLAAWKFPRLEILETAGQVAVIGLVVEDRLKVENIEATNLLPIDSAALANAIPASVLKAEPGAPIVRQVASYYAPAGDYGLSAKFVRPPAELKVAGNSLLIIGDAGLTLQGGFALTPLAESLFEFSFALPTGWQVMQVTAADGKPLPIERYLLPSGEKRVLVRLPRGIAIGQTETVSYQTIFAPSGWLTDGTTQTIEIPNVRVTESTSDSGAVAVQTIDDLVARPDKIDGLMPLLDNEKSMFGLAGIPTALAYRYENRDYSARVSVERTAPSLTCRVLSFFKLERDNLAVHYELAYEVREARTRQVAFTLPITTPAELTIRGLENTTVKQFSSQEQDDRRRWTVQLGQRQSGRVRLAIDFTQRLPESAQQNADLPLARAEDVMYQSGLVAIEGDAELDVSVKTTAREVDIGELAGAEYALGRRVIGSYGYVGVGSMFQATISRRSLFALPPALVQRAELVTKVAASGRAQSVARYDLLTKATLLEIRLPADSTLWTVYLDDQPTKPQRENESLLLSLPAQEQVRIRKLQIVYESATSPLGISGAIDAAAPELLVRAAGSDAERVIPQADLQWQLFLPNGYSVRGSDGTVEAEGIAPREMAAVKVLRFFYELGGGISWRRYAAANRLSWIRGGFDGVEYSRQEPRSDSRPYPASAAPAGGPVTAPQLRMEHKLAESAVEAQSLAAKKPKDAFNLADKSESERTSSGDNSRLGRAATTNLGILAGKEADTKHFWALEGVSTLKIDLEPDSGSVTTFHSLGNRPELVASVIDERRITPGAVGLAGLVLLIGVALTFQAVRKQVTYVAVVLLAATVPPLLTAKIDHWGLVFDYVFLAGCALVIYYPLAALVLTVARRIKASFSSCVSQPFVQVGAAAVIAAAFCVAPSSSFAQSATVLEDTRPVSIPADAIIVPYDPERADGQAAAEKLLVPYSKYVELWNQANPGKKIDATPPPVGYAIAGTHYEMTLTAGDFLSLAGRMEIEVYSDKPVAVPLALGGGVLEKATVDGQAARLQVVEQQGDARVSQSKVPASSKTAAPSSRLLLLHLSGKGRKSAEFRIRLGLTRQGGWRMVRGQVPVGPAAALTLIAPDTGTEIRQMSLADRASFETKTPGERIESSLLPNGQLNLQWRPKIGEGMVDQALTAHSTAVFDVREDSLRLTWQFRLDFGRAYRDAFSFTIPADYLVESVTGDNVRGWNVKPQDNQQRIDVTLLKPVQSSETLTMQVAKRGHVGEEALAEFDAPVVQVEGAALEQGEIVVRKSSRLELRTLASSGLTRADSNRQTAVIEHLADATDAAVLVVRPYQTFRFARPPYRLTLSANELQQQATADVRAALRIADRETTLDAAIVFRPQGLPLYRVRLYLPNDFTLDRVTPVDLEWSVTNDNGRQLLTVHLLDGRTGEFTLALFGKFSGVAGKSAEAPQPWSLNVPQIEVLDVQKQAGEIVILPDPDTDVRLDELRNAEAAPLTIAPAWMKAAQQPLAKAVLKYRTADYEGTIHVMSRTPVISARTITNIKVTPRSIEETVLLNFRIEQAGIRSIAFLVPDHLAKARLKAPLVKQKMVAPATNVAGQPIAGMMRMTLELQDFVRGDYALLLEQDRLLTADRQIVTLPVLETGRTDRRLLAIENAGRDEVVIDEKGSVGLDPINRQQQAWRDLTSVLGENMTQAFAARDDVPEPGLKLTTIQRKQAERAGARIGLATTLLVVDASGAYRAVVQYRLTNATEQFLQLTLPAGARLWTAAVAGEPVKPAEAVPPKPGIVRLPLIKTAEGEGDYLVELKYGGRIATLGGLSGTPFPLIRQTSVNVEQSQLRLLLPESRQWFNFQGTMGRVAEETELFRGFQSYLCTRIQDAASSLSSSNDYTKIRAAINLKESRAMLNNSLAFNANGATTQADSSWEGYLASNATLLSQAEQQVQSELSGQHQQHFDNRERLNQYFGQQNVERAKNVVSQLGSNFDAAQRDTEKTKAGDTVNELFFAQNQLATERVLADAELNKASEPARKLAPSDGNKAGKAIDSRYLRGARPAADAKRAQTAEGKPEEAKLPEIAAKRELDELQRRLADEPANDDLRRRAGAEESEQLQKYRMNLEQNLSRNQQLSQGQQLQPGIEGPSQQSDFGMRAPRGGIRAGGINAGGEGAPGGIDRGGFGGGFAAPGMPGQAESNAPGGPFGIPAPGGMPGAPQPAAPLAVTADFDALTATRGEQMAQLAAGLASLDVQIPERGRIYRFTTPRGEISVTANSVSRDTLSRLLGLAGVLAAVLVIWFLSREMALQVWQQLSDSTIVGFTLIILGFASLFAGVLPVAGMLLIVSGIVIVVRSRRASTHAAWR